MPTVYRRDRAAGFKVKETPEGLRIASATGGIETKGGLASADSDLDPQVAALVAHGFAVVVVDLPGRGASFGGDFGSIDTRKRRTVRDTATWTAEQSWSNGQVGATGLSWNGAATLSFLNELLARQSDQEAQGLLLAITDFSPAASRLVTDNPVMSATEIHCEALVDTSLSGTGSVS